MSQNAALNVFLAILENRPEAYRQTMGHLPERIPASDLATIYGRIQQAAENIKCRAVKDSIRLVWNQLLRLSAPVNELTSDLEDTLNKAYPEAEETVDPEVRQALENAYLRGVQDVEDILARVLNTCEETEKRLGPNSEAVS